MTEHEAKLQEVTNLCMLIIDEQVKQYEPHAMIDRGINQAKDHIDALLKFPDRDIRLEVAEWGEGKIIKAGILASAVTDVTIPFFSSVVQLTDCGEIRSTDLKLSDDNITEIRESCEMFTEAYKL